MRKRDKLVLILLSAAAGAGIHHLAHCKVKPVIAKFRRDVKEFQETIQESWNPGSNEFLFHGPDLRVPEQTPGSMDDLADKQPANVETPVVPVPEQKIPKRRHRYTQVQDDDLCVRHGVSIHLHECEGIDY